MLSTINQYYFEIAGISTVLFLVTAVILGFSITQEQVEEKRNTGDTKYTPIQNLLIYLGVGSFWMVVSVSILTVIAELTELLASSNFGM
jgi:amino acid transporter